MNEIVPMNGYIRIESWERLACGIERKLPDKKIKNLIVDVGKDAILEYLGGVNNTIYKQIGKIGVGNSSQIEVSSDTALIGSSSLLKLIDAGSRVYVRPTLFVSIELGYAEANFTINEIGLFDTDENIIARKVDDTPIVKNTNKRLLVEWQLSL